MQSDVARQATHSRPLLQIELVVVVDTEEDVVLGGVGEGSAGKAILWPPRARQTRKHFSIATARVVTRLVYHQISLALPGTPHCQTLYLPASLTVAHIELVCPGVSELLEVTIESGLLL